MYYFLITQKNTRNNFKNTASHVSKSIVRVTLVGLFLQGGMAGLMDVMAKRRQTRIAGGRVSDS